ncbi:MIP/aquaporin family protein [soil metagenome]
MHPFIYEFLGTAVLILFGNGVVANVVLNKSKGQNSGWIVIAFGWAMAVFFGVMVSMKGSGAHLNPAVTLTMAYLGRLDWSQVPVYLAGQMLGAMTGSLLVYLSYKQHFDETENADGKLACFCTHPAIRNPFYNFLTEMIATAVFIIGVLFIASPATSMGTIEALPVTFLVLAVGLSLGGSTGYAINPARDLGPRIMHFLLPVKGKRNSDWGYAWIPVIAPIVGGLLGTWVYHALQSLQ